ncbi:hypothetical protein [Streptomyces sp. NBC_01233]|uniref:hypothetical protein n=1 Tax=Streptomyces sp. NBC_01233 TaxID=2903787 RepID=UPI002E0F30A2|nr:hypothetical protein OG332_14305 [Streptomyces sp. NBC_01233]
MTDLTMRDLLAPVAAIALIAQANPDLPVPRIDLGPVFDDTDAHSIGVHLYFDQPAPGTYERWANLIGSENPDSHTRPSSAYPNTLIRRTYGAYAGVAIEATAHQADDPAGRAVTADAA